MWCGCDTGCGIKKVQLHGVSGVNSVVLLTESGSD